MQQRLSVTRPLTSFSVSVDRRLTRILLTTSNVETTTPENNDGFCRWATPETGSACAAATDSEPATREVVEPTRCVAGRHSIQAPATTGPSYGDLKEGGLFDRRTFCYVPGNGAYVACKAAVRLNVAGQRRWRYGKTRSTRGVEGAGATSRMQSCADDASASRRDVTAVRQQRAMSGTNQSSRNDADPVEQPDTVHVSPQQLLRCHAKEKDARPSRAGRNGGETTAGTCCADMDRADKINAEQEQRRSDSRLMKTWLYNFLPPIVTTQLGHGDADAPRGNLADVRGQTSRAVGGRSCGRRPSDERHPAVVSRKPPDDRDQQKASARRQQLPPAATDAVEHGHRQGRGHVVDVERRRRRRLSGSPTDDYRVLLTEVCQPPHCDCPRHRDLYSDDEDATETTSRFADDDDDDDDDESNGHSSDHDDDDDDDDEAEEEAEEGENKKEALKSFNSKKMDSKEARQCLQLSLTGRVADIHRRHEETCKS